MPREVKRLGEDAACVSGQQRNRLKTTSGNSEASELHLSEDLSNPACIPGCKSPKVHGFGAELCPSAHRLCHASHEWPIEAVRFLSVRKTFWNLAHEKHNGLIVVA
jgi:hypothetical protein